MPLPLAISCCSKSRLVLPSWFTFLVLAHPGSPGHSPGAVKRLPATAETGLMLVLCFCLLIVKSLTKTRKKTRLLVDLPQLSHSRAVVSRIRYYLFAPALCAPALLLITATIYTKLGGMALALLMQYTLEHLLWFAVMFI